MTRTLTDLQNEMRAVARGERKAPPRPAKTEAGVDLFGVLTPSNRALLQVIGRDRPESVSKLAELTGRAQSNVSRSLQELAKFGLVRMVRDGQSIRPELAVIHVDIDLIANECHPVAIAAAE
ncbi:MAG: MarR family transcriptional regulator [Rhodospirillales bacterium]|nr:MarR family transcriptional regulator [Rhodospirillales bacterium]